MTAAVVLVVIAAGVMIFREISSEGNSGLEIEIEEILHLTSERKEVKYDHVSIQGENRMWGIASVPAACWYEIDDGVQHVIPLLVDGDPGVRRFIEYTGKEQPQELKGKDGESMFDPTTSLAVELFEKSSGLMVMGTTDDDYELGLTAAPLASYLDIPIVIIDGSNDGMDISRVAGEIDAEYLLLVGRSASDLGSETGMDRIVLEDMDRVHSAVFKVIDDRFGRLDYGVMTNPGDTIGPEVIDILCDTTEQEVDSLLIDTATVDMDIIGSSTYFHAIEVPEGIVDLKVYVNFTEISGSPLDPLKENFGVEPLSFGTLRDQEGRLVAYSPSFAVEPEKNYLETLVIDDPGTYELELKVYFGLKGLSTMMGTSLGASRITGTYTLESKAAVQSTPHLPMFEGLSFMAPYLAAARGGFVLADRDLELTSVDYADKASGFGTGPWYENELLDAGREKVEQNVVKLRHVIDIADKEGLAEGYLEGRGWLALLGGGNMLPMYYEEKDPSWEEDPVWGTGWATDLPYSLNLSLSVGRPLGRSLSDVSGLIARTIFYEEYTEGFIQDLMEEYGSSGSWKDHFHFLAGEGGGRTGWLFHQREFSSIARDHGFDTEVYMQDYENDRQTMILKGAYERANYFEMVLHGDWSWFSPELNGIDRYSTGVKVTDLIGHPDDWELGPSIFNSGVCLLGRFGGLRPEQSITQAFFHSGINAFFCATRSTGSEAKAGPIEEALLFEDLSVGEAIRKDKRDNPEVPTYFVRTLFGDPAFNPYEPENGYGDQGLAELKNRNKE
ncbi:MAG: C25 family cysteine peptidase [Thermoplasmatota archaeon]